MPYTIDENDYYAVVVIEDDCIVPYEAISSEYVRYKDKVYKVVDLKIQERFVLNDYRVITIAPFHSCTTIEKNDKYLEKLQNCEMLQEDLYKLKEQVHKNKSNKIEE